MAEPKIPIQFTADQAKRLLEERHAISYRDSILGATVRAVCSCGWSSPSLTTGWIAQEAANRHHVAFVAHPLENRVQYAIFRRTCLACNGEGVLRGRDGSDLGECPHCYAGHLWVILDRIEEDEPERYAATQSLAMDRLWDDLRYGMESTA